jgi:hypothetical protein
MAGRRPDCFWPGGSSTVATHQQQTSTGTADVKSFSTPSNAVACYVSATTNPARLTVDGTTPSATNGIVVPAGALPFELRAVQALKVASTAAANSIVDVAFLV